MRDSAPTTLAPRLLPTSLQALQSQYVSNLPARLDEVQTLWDRWTAHAGRDAAACEALHQCVHKISGSAGIFGLPELSMAARAMEQQVSEAMRLDAGRWADVFEDMASAHLHMQVLARAAYGQVPAEGGDGPAVCTDGVGVEAVAQKQLAGVAPAVPWRVLLVDDDEPLLQAHATILREVGMSVMTLCHPDQTPAAVRLFEPDVVLLDVYMPGTSGPELASVLRREESLLHLPILFVSGETDLTQQLLALSLGGDDFLIKPVQPAHLVAAVTARARRSRQVLAVQRRLETTLYEREREHFALDHHAIVSVADHAGTITSANALFCQVTGYAASELEGQTYHHLLHGLQPEGFVRSISATIREGRVWHGEVCGRRKDGALFWLESTVTPFFDAAGHVYQVIAIQTDITHIKRAENALRRQRDMQRVISVAAAGLLGASHEQTGSAIDQALDDGGTQLGVEEAYLFTFSRDGLRMRNTHLWCAPGSPARAHDMLQLQLVSTSWMRERFLREGVVSVADVAALPDEAAEDKALLQAHGIRALLVLPVQKNGMPMGFIGFSVLSQPRDWTVDEIDLLKVLADVIGGAMARQRAEAALRASEARLHFLVTSSPVTIYTADAQPPHEVTYVSPNVRAMTALASRGLQGASSRLAQSVHPQDRDRMARHWPAVVAEGQHGVEYRLDTGDGHHRWIHDQCLLVRNPAGEPMELIGYWMDIDLRKRAEHALETLNRELEHRVEVQTRSVMESARVAHATLDAMSARVVILDRHGVILAANRAWKATDAEHQVHEGANYLHRCEQVGEGALTAGPALAEGIRQVIGGEQPSFLREYSVPVDSEMHWFVCRAERFLGEGEVRVVVSHEDITQMKQVERQHLRSQRLESLGTLAGGVAHDVNNALAPILMGMGMLKEQFPQEAKLFDLMHNSASRGAGMVRQLLTFARGVEGERVPVQAERLVDEIKGLVQGSFPKNIELQVDCEPDLPLVVGDTTQLHQILLNLCVNARDAMPEGGVIELSVRHMEIDAAYARAIEDARPGSYVAVRVSDTGSGIAPEILDRIFDPFFTTKTAERGTGLGLSTVLGLVRSHGGFLQVYSQPGLGSTFVLYLPVALSSKVSVPQIAGASEWCGQGETVLFVDDEAAVREVGRTVLERLNLRPVLATDGVDALLQISTHRAKVRAVITDLHMPHLDGLAFVRALRRTFPHLPVVVASGRLDATVAKAFEALGVVARLDKPFTEVQLKLVLRDLLRVSDERQKQHPAALVGPA